MAESTESRHIRIIIADDHAIMRDGIRARVEAEGIEVVAEAGGGEETIRLVDEFAPDVVLADVRMPDTDGIEVARRLSEAGSPTRTLMFSGFVSQALVERAMRAGANGYVAKDSHRTMLVQAIRIVADGGTFVDPAVQATTVDWGGASFTPRELDVLPLLADGLANLEIAERLGVAPETVRAHVSAIMRKLGARSRTEAVARALRSFMVE